MLRGIDVSSHDGWSTGRFGKQNTETAYGESDFVIAKATQGTGYVNKYCDPAIQRAKSDGKLWGFYHYAGGNDPVAEANFFYNNCKNYFGEGIPCLDWERTQNSSWGSTTWCRRFVDRIHELTGIWCMVYIQASAVGQAASCASDCALWIAGYPDNRNSWDMPTFRYGTGAWSTWTVWQYTSSGELTDRNYAQLTREGWLAIAGASQPSGTAGWVYDESDADKQWYRHADGSYTVNDWELIDGEWYHFDASGWVQWGWFCDDAGKWYWLHDKHDGRFGACDSGWITDAAGDKYFASQTSGDPWGSLCTGVHVIDGEQYCFADAPSCRLVRNAAYASGGKVYVADSEGRAVRGRIAQVGGKMYALGDDGAAMTGAIVLQAGEDGVLKATN